MSLRDFNAPSEDRPVILNHEPMGNSGGLGNFHTVNPEDREPNNTGRIVGALAVALMVGAGGLYAYTATGNHPKPVTTAANLPSPPPAAPQPAAMTPAPESTAAMDAAPAAMTPAPVRTASARRSAPISEGAAVRMSADSQALTSQPAQQAVVIPEPVSPTPSPSDVAIANPQSGVAVSPNAVTAQDMPAQAAMPDAAQPEAAAPAQAQPEQSAGQVAQ